MESEIRMMLRVANLLGFLIGIGISIAASNAGMLIGAVAMSIGVALATPSVASHWSKREEVPTD